MIRLRPWCSKRTSPITVSSFESFSNPGRPPELRLAVGANDGRSGSAHDGIGQWPEGSAATEDAHPHTEPVKRLTDLNAQRAGAASDSGSLVYAKTSSLAITRSSAVSNAEGIEGRRARDDHAGAGAPSSIGPTARRRFRLKEPEPDSASALLRTIDDSGRQISRRMRAAKPPRKFVVQSATRPKGRTLGPLVSPREGHVRTVRRRLMRTAMTFISLRGLAAWRLFASRADFQPARGRRISDPRTT